jgi:hypothetical protein
MPMSSVTETSTSALGKQGEKLPWPETARFVPIQNVSAQGIRVTEAFVTL